MAFHFNAAASNVHPLRTYNTQTGTLFNLSGAPSTRAYWKAAVPGDPYLINATGRYSYGALNFSYLLDAYAVAYGSLNFSYLLGGLVLGDASSTGVAVSTATSAGTLFQTLVASSTGVAVSTAAIKKIVDGNASSTAVAVAAMTLNQIAFAVASNTAVALVTVSFQGQEYSVWVTNEALTATTRYTNYNFNSFARIGNRYYGVNAAGLFELDGGDDNGTPIDASVMLGRDRENSTQVKRAGRVYLHGTSDNHLVLRLVTDQGAVFVYETELKLSDFVSAQRVVLGNGLSAQYWQLEIKNKDGGKFSLNQIEIVSLHTQRKIKR